MSKLFTVGTHGTPISVIDTEHFSDWLKSQSAQSKSWMAASGYKGTGLCLIPGTDGTLSAVVYGVDDLNKHFACGSLVTQLPEGDYRIDGDEALSQRVAFSWGVGAYTFNRYKNNRKALPTLVLPTKAQKEQAERTTSATTLVRDLINTPAEDMMPQHLGEVIESLAKTFGAEVQQIIGDDLLTQNYPTIHAVGRASVHAPRLIDLRWGDASHPKVTLVGKGVCFDSGGLNIKPTGGIRLMKKDMGGAANAIGLAELIMAQQLPVRLRLLIPAVENAIANNAFRPGDVITTRKGLTVEVDNTDAEGRLVLCDALAEADTENPDLLMDFATLTGACRVGLGTELPGLFTNQDSLARELMTAGVSVDDPVWNLPLFAPYREYLKSDIADLLNRGPDAGGAITAALYLEKFVSPSTPWMHFDLMAWNTRPLPGRPVGGEAMSIRAVFAYLCQRYA